MTEPSLDELGPVELPVGATILRDMVTELVALVDAGTTHLSDVLILTKGGDGLVDAIELSDVRALGAREAIKAELPDLLVRRMSRSSPQPWPAGAPPVC